VATRIKFCGITSLEDAELCAGHDPWALGLIFVPSSRRRVKQAEAARISGAMRRRVELVGVFQNAPLDHVARTVESLELPLVQLHGDEGPSYCGEVARRTGARVIKAVRVRARADVIALGAYGTDFHMLDGPGNGQPFDWGLVNARRGAKASLIVAGGLTPENVADAITVTTPWAVDVASGIEREGQSGVKDPAKVAAFAEAVAGAEVTA
jgi:phosphoribosylanthranilate isomerase